MGAGIIQVTKNTKFKITNSKKNILDSIPDELLIDIVARVAASSCRDLFKAKFSCRALNKFADDKNVIRRVSLESFPVVPWTSKNCRQAQAVFSDRCADSENPEALYRRGIARYFEKMEMSSGIECLLRAAESEHLEAMYVLGMIMILHGDETKEQGMKMIINMKKVTMTRTKIKNIRENVSRTLRKMWVKNTMIVGQGMPTCCTVHEHPMSSGWEELVDSECEACSCDQEIVYLGQILPKSV